MADRRSPDGLWRKGWWSMLRRSQMARLGVAAVALIALLTACAPRGPAKSAQTPQPAGPPAIVTRSASADAPEGSDYHLSVSASCRPGEQMLAGGYALEDVFESDYRLLADYPAANNTWRVDTESGSHYQLQALTYCLTNSPSLGIQALQASACPAGMTLLRQGFKGATPLTGSAGTPYTLCAARGVTLTAHGVRVGGVELDCASQATGNDLSETRSFSSTCAPVRVTP